MTIQDLEKRSNRKTQRELVKRRRSMKQRFGFEFLFLFVRRIEDCSAKELLKMVKCLFSSEFYKNVCLKIENDLQCYSIRRLFLTRARQKIHNTHANHQRCSLELDPVRSPLPLTLRNPRKSCAKSQKCYDINGCTYAIYNGVAYECVHSVSR